MKQRRGKTMSDYCKGGCVYSRSMMQTYPRKCLKCGLEEAPKHLANFTPPTKSIVTLQQAREALAWWDDNTEPEAAQGRHERTIRRLLAERAGE